MKNLEYFFKSSVLSERSYKLNESGVYVFRVPVKVSKDEIKTALNKIFGCSVVGINTSICRGKSSRKARSKSAGPVSVKTPNYKKVFVRLKSGQTLPVPVLGSSESQETLKE